MIKVHQNYDEDTIVIEGTRFSGEFFRTFNSLLEGSTFRLMRDEKGTVSIQKMPAITHGLRIRRI